MDLSSILSWALPFINHVSTRYVVTSNLDVLWTDLHVPISSEARTPWIHRPKVSLLLPPAPTTGSTLALASEGRKLQPGSEDQGENVHTSRCAVYSAYATFRFLLSKSFSRHCTEAILQTATKILRDNAARSDTGTMRGVNGQRLHDLPLLKHFRRASEFQVHSPPQSFSLDFLSAQYTKPVSIL